MHWTGWIVIALSFLLGGWMLFDGSRALVKGDYATPSTGEYVGQLGPWADLVESVGLDPRSDFMKTVFVVYGLLWLIAAAGFVFGIKPAWHGLLALSIFSLLYLPFGTIIGIINGILLLLPPIRFGFLE